MPQLTAILDEVFGAQPMAHWHEVFNGVHVTFGAVRGPQEVINDPQLRANDIVVPLEGAGGKLTSTISSPIQVHGVAKCLRSARRRSENTTKRSSSSSGSARPKSTACARAARCRKQKNTGRHCRAKYDGKTEETTIDTQHRAHRTGILLVKSPPPEMPTRVGMSRDHRIRSARSSNEAADEAKQRSAYASWRHLTEQAPLSCAFIRSASPGEMLGVAALRLLSVSWSMAMQGHRSTEGAWRSVIYEYQEGRGIGLMAKSGGLRATGCRPSTTVSGQSCRWASGRDCRDFSLAAAILDDLASSGVRLLSNNPRKASRLG